MPAGLVARRDKALEQEVHIISAVQVLILEILGAAGFQISLRHFLAKAQIQDFRIFQLHMAAQVHPVNKTREQALEAEGLLKKDRMLNQNLQLL